MAKRDPQDTLLLRSSESKKNWTCFLASLNQQKFLPLLAAAAGLAKESNPSLKINGLKVQNYIIEAN